MRSDIVGGMKLDRAQPRIRETPSKSDLAKARLLAAALEKFGEKNLEGASVREIAEAAGQNVASIFYHFGSKENLYLALLRSIAREMHNRLADTLTGFRAIRDTGKLTPDDALEMLKGFLRTVVVKAMSRDDMLPVARLIVREQTRPTAAFDVVYEESIRELHETVTHLIATATGADPKSSESILRAHMLIGQVKAFVVGRATICRRLGWASIEGRNTQTIVRVLEENIDALVIGLREARSGE